MINNIELPVKKSWYNTLNWQASAGVVANNSIYCDNWYLTNSINLCCEKQFLNEFKLYSPRLVIDNTHPWSIPLIDKYEFPKIFLKHSISEVVSAALESGYYLYFNGFDDYYIENKQGFNSYHNSHDGMIVGINNVKKDYSIYAYDLNNKLRCFQTSQISFENAFNSFPNEGVFLALKNNDTKYNYDFNTFIKNLKSYFLSKQTDVYKSPDKFIFGIDAISHVAEYVKSFYDQNISFALFDLRNFLSISENKNCIYHSLLKALDKGFLNRELCSKYNKIYQQSEMIRMLSIKFVLVRNADILKSLYESILKLFDMEQELLPIILSYNN